MKTKIKRHSRAVLSIVLTLCMLVSCMTVGIIATDAAKTADQRVGAKADDGEESLGAAGDWYIVGNVAGANNWSERDAVKLSAVTGGYSISVQLEKDKDFRLRHNDKDYGAASDSDSDRKVSSSTSNHTLSQRSSTFIWTGNPGTYTVTINSDGSKISFDGSDPGGGGSSGGAGTDSGTSFPQSWHDTGSNSTATIYYDNSITQWSSVKFRIGRHWNYGNEAQGYTFYNMTKVTGTDNIYKCTIDFGKYTAFYFTNGGTDGWATGDIEAVASKGFTAYTSPKGFDLGSSTYFFIGQSATVGTAAAPQRVLCYGAAGGYGESTASDYTTYRKSVKNNSVSNGTVVVNWTNPSGTAQTIAEGSTTTNILIGTKLTVDMTGDTGYAPGTATVTYAGNASSVTVPAGGSTFTSGNTNTEVTGSFVRTENYHAVTFSADPAAGGTVSPSTGTEVGESTSTEITATPSAGYQFSSWTFGTGIVCANQTVNPISITTNNTGSGYTVQANFSRNYYTLSKGAESNGTFTAVAANPDGSGKVPFEDTVTVNCTPAKGYKVNTVTYGAETASVDVGNPNRWTFDMPAGDTTVNVEFVKKDNAITASASPVGGGTVWAASSASSDVSLGNYKIGEAFYLRANPDPAYNFTKFTVTYADGATQDYTDNPQELTLDTTHFNDADGAISVVGYFTAKPTHTVTAVSNNDTMGTVSASPASAYEGQTVTLTYSEGTTGVIRSMTTNVAGVTPAKGEGTTYTFTMPDQDITATATFGKPIVSFRASGSGSVTATVGGEPITSGTEVDKGTSVTFTATPDENYLFSKWTGSATGTTSPVTVTANSNLSVTGNFEMMGYYFISNVTSEKMTEVSDGIYVTSSTYSGTYWFKILRENDQYVSKSTKSDGGAAMTKYQKYDVQGWEAKDSGNTYGYTNAFSYALPSGSGAVYVVYDANRNQVYFTDSDKGYYPVDIYIKDGTIRQGMTGSGSCDFGDTEIVSDGTTTGLTTDDTVYSGFATKVSLTAAQIAEGVTIHVKTTVKAADAYKNNYYVKGFDVNGGLTRATIEPEYYSKNDPTEANRYKEKSCADYEDKDAYDKIHPTGDRAYNEFILDVSGYPDQNIEVTPIYFPKTDDSRNFIRFYAEDFTETVKDKWDGSLAVYPYIESPDFKPYGKYPGQLMVKEGGRYYSDILKKDSSDNAMQGLTMNNYAWDDVHYNLFLAPKYGSTEDNRKKANRQTYDYNEFVIINKILESNPKLIDEDIIFSFKYKDEVALSSSNMGQAVYYTEADPVTKADDATYGYNNKSTMSNFDDASWKWEDLTDYYDNKVDILGSRIDTTGTDPKANYHPIRVVSNGYDRNSTGYYATSWALFKPVDSSGNDAFDPAATVDHYVLFEVIGGQGHTDYQSQSMLINPDETKRIHMKYDAAYNAAHTDTEGSTYWKDQGYPQSRLVQDCAMIPAVISYEYEGLSDSPNDSANNGTKYEWAHRSDGRWFYSDPEQLIKANVVVEIANSKKGPWSIESRDYFQPGNVDFNDEGYNPAANTGLVSGVSAYFTNSDTVTKDGTDYVNVSTHTQAYAISDGEHEYQMVTEGDPDGNYIFLGWYRLSKDGTDVTLASEDENFNVVANANDVFIARWYKSSSGNLKITHNLLSDSIGQGKVDCKTQVKIMEEGNDTPIATLPNSPTTSAINLTGKYIKSNSPYYLQIELSTTSQKEGEFIFDSFWDNVDGGLLQELDEHGLLTDVTITDNTAVIRLSIASLFTDDGESDPELKTTSLDFFSKMKLPDLHYNLTYGYDSMIGSNQQYGSQTTEVKGNFTDEEFNRYIVWDDSIVTDDVTSKTGWYKFNPDTYVEFLASKCPYEKNIRRNLTWNYNSLIKEQNGPWYYASDGEFKFTITASDPLISNKRLNFVLPYYSIEKTDSKSEYLFDENGRIQELSSDAEPSAVGTDSEGKTATFSRYLKASTEFATPYAKDGVANYVTAPEVIYNDATPRYFQYWSVQTVPNYVESIEEASYRRYEVARCYNLEYNFSAYQDYIVEAKYGDTRSTHTHVNTATITFAENGRNQWNKNKGKASWAQGDRIFSNFIVSFDRADKIQLNTLGAGDPDIKTGVVFEQLDTLPDFNHTYMGLEANDWTVQSEMTYFQKYSGKNTLEAAEAADHGKADAIKHIKGEATTVTHTYMDSTIKNTNIDNKNRIEFTKAFANINTTDFAPTTRKNYVYRAYAYMQEADGSVTISTPVYFQFYDIATIANATRQTTPAITG